MQIVRESIAPAVRQQRGLRSLLQLQDPNTGKSMLISVFETEADAKAGVGNGFVQQQADKLASLLAGAPTVEFYEVVTQE
jgi:heme-degrading monooxygenase HmoA